jgi:hypothetical protein
MWHLPAIHPLTRSVAIPVSDCTDKIWGPLWKALNIDPKTGLPKDGSALPPEPQRDLVPAVVSPPPAALPAARDPTANPKTRYSGPP